MMGSKKEGNEQKDKAESHMCNAFIRITLRIYEGEQKRLPRFFSVCRVPGILELVEACDEIHDTEEVEAHGARPVST